MKRISRRFHWAALAMSIVILFGCAAEGRHRYDRAPSSNVSMARTFAVAVTSGPQVAVNLQKRYDDSQATCRDLPALLCSGVLLRVTKRGNGYNAWNPNPNSPQPNGVSFSWLRHDANFNKLAYGYNDGFIVLPYFSADAPGDNFTQLTVLCAFALDAATDNRRSTANDGCGAYPGFDDSGACQTHGVFNATNWLMKFQYATNPYAQQCGFTLTPGTAGAGQAFASIIGIRQQMANRLINLQNEIMISTWAQNDPRLPLEAFFSVGTLGLADAKANQLDFKLATKRWVPVIRITLSQTIDGVASFTYNDSDQGVSPSGL